MLNYCKLNNTVYKTILLKADGKPVYMCVGCLKVIAGFLHDPSPTPTIHPNRMNTVCFCNIRYMHVHTENYIYYIFFSNP